MTQLNENTKLGDLKAFFPRSCYVLRQYGIDEHYKVDEVSLRSLCDLYEIDLYQLLSEISKYDEYSANVAVPSRFLH